MTQMNASTSLGMTQGLLEDRRTLWALATLMLILFSVTNLPWELDDYDQAKQAWTSYEMVTEGHWFYQRTSDDQGLATKPPLTGWISAVIFFVTRSWDVAWRLPSLLCAALIAFMLFRSASRAYGNVTGLIAFAAFGFNLLSPRLATLVRSDMPLALVIFLIGLLIWEKIRTGEPWRTQDRWLMFGLLTAGMLIKGPIVYAFLLPGILFFELWARRRPAFAERLRRGEDACLHRAWCGWWPWLVSLAIFLIWVVAGWLWVPRFYELVIVREFLARFGEIGTHLHRSQSFFFYVAHLLHKFFPWSAVLIGLTIIDLRSRKLDRLKRSSSEEVSEAEKISPQTLWLICWSIGGLVLMSLIPSKRVDRIFPVIPPLCLLVAVQSARFLNDEKHRARNFRWAAAILALAVLFSAGYAGSRVVTGYRDHRDALSIFGRQVREEAARNHWRYEAVGKSDEGLPLYLTRPHFLKPDVAVAEWNSGKIDALAVPANEAPQLMRELHDSTRRFESEQRKNLHRPNYILLTH
jgi:4-amino-4-deoxy-L-arabinose transferase-like glycosyltransferase